MKVAVIALLLLAAALPAASLAGAAANPTCSLEDVTAPEGTIVNPPDQDGGPSVGSTVFRFELTCQVPANTQFTLGVTALDGTANAGDYALPDQSIVFSSLPTDQVRQVPVDVFVAADPFVEPDETFSLQLTTNDPSVVLTKGTAVGTILNDDTGTPCILLSDTSASVSATVSTATTPRHGNTGTLTITNCGPAVNLRARGTDATGASGTWQLTNASSGGAIDSTCELGLNIFRASLSFPNSQGGAGGGAALTTQDTTLLDQDLATPFVLAAIAAQQFLIDVEMPCDGSDGIGQAMSMDVVVTAIVAP